MNAPSPLRIPQPVASALVVLMVLVAAGCGSSAAELASGSAPAQDIVVASPDGAVQVRVALDTEGRPTYAVQHDGTPIVLPSPLGLTFQEGGSLSAGMEVVGVTRNSHDETYTLVAGPTKTARNHYNEATVSLRETGGHRRRLDLVFRAYDDGAAFRYALPAQSGLAPFALTEEQTTFRFPEDERVWTTTYGSYTTSQENEFVPIPLSDITTDDVVGLPLVVQKSRGVTVAVTEADLNDYAGMYLGAASNGAPHTLVTKLSPRLDDDGVLVRGSAPHVTPWRVLMIGATPGALIESSLILNLNPPPTMDFSWVEPGKVMFPWWPDFRTDDDPAEDPSESPTEFTAPPDGDRINYENQVYNVDFASEYGIRYIEMEPPWYGDEKTAIEQPLTMDITTPIPELRLPELLRYADERDVHFLMWVHWESLEAQMEEAFETYERWGAKGVKIDFMNRDDQEMVNWYHEVLESAARHHMVVYLHGAYKPTGISRTWPNLLTRESVMGLEYNKWSERLTPAHNVTLPFTRMLIGPMDYTPGGFSNVTPDEFRVSYSRPYVMTTRAQQLAMYVVYLSPLQMVADYPGAYRGQPESEFIRDVPTSWDETRVLSGTIGEHIVIARRRGDEWFVGAMTNEEPREMAIPLDFLGEGAYTAEIYADGAEPKDVTVSTQTVSADGSLRARLASGGGYAVRLAPSR